MKRRKDACVVCVACVCQSGFREVERGRDDSGESRSLRSATIVVEHLRESGAERGRRTDIMWSVVGRSERSGVRVLECDTCCGAF